MASGPAGSQHRRGNLCPEKDGMFLRYHLIIHTLLYRLLVQRITGNCYRLTFGPLRARDIVLEHTEYLCGDRRVQ